jgi:vacuolar-type H+-ATPase subunit E/Vma4
MSLSAILKVIQDNGEARAREIEDQAQIQAHEVMANIKAQALQALKETREAMLLPAARERARIVHHARLEALRIIGDVRETLVDTALEQTRGHLLNIRSYSVYSAVLRRLTEEALAELSNSLEEIGKSQLEADPRDQESLEKILFDMGLDLPVNYELRCWGGLIVRSEDGRVVIINTLDARFERATPYLRRYLAAMFEEGRSETMFSRKDEVTAGFK